MTLFSVRKNLGLVFVAVAFTFAITFSAFAQDYSGPVKTVRAPNPAGLINGTLDDSKLVELPMKSAEIPGLQGSKDLGPAAPDMKLGMQLVLRRTLQQQQAVELLKQQTMDPKNPMYGKTLTPEEFARTFGLTASDLAAIKSWLEEKGFTVGTVDNGRLSINFEGTVDQVNAAFHTDIHSYTTAKGESRYAYATELKIPVALASTVGMVKGLENFTAFQPKGFDGPVTDFESGTIGEPMVSEDAPKTTPEVIREGDMPGDASFTASTESMQFGGTTKLNVRISGSVEAPMGSLLISDQDGKSVGFISDISSCEPYNDGLGRSCSLNFTPAVAGSYLLKASYSGDKNIRGVEQFVHSNATGSQTTYTVEVPVPTGYNATSGAGATPNGVITVVVSWVASGTAPSGTLALADQTGQSYGTATLPTPPATTSTGTSTPYVGTSSYSCTTTLASQIVTCTVTDSNINGSTYYDFSSTASVSYSGDSNYAASSGSTVVYKEYGKNGTGASIANTGAITASPALTAATYGSTQAETTTVSILYNPTYSGDVILGNGTFALVQAIGNGALGSMGNVSPSATCAPTTSTPCTASLSFTVPAVVTPGSYNVYFAYSGDTYWDRSNSYYGLFGPSNSANYVLTVNPQTPTFGTMSFSPSNTVHVGTNEAVTISDTLAWTGLGAAPTGAVTYNLNGTNYTATCTSTTTPATSPLICAATVPGATIAALAVNSYTVTAGYTTDTNYATTTGASGTFTITNSQTSGSVFTGTPTNQTYGSGGTVALKDVISIPNTITPNSADTVIFTNSAGVTAIYSTTISTCTMASGSPNNTYTCSYTWTPPAGASGDNAGTYTVSAAFSGDSNVLGSTGSFTFVLAKSGTTTTLTANPTYTNATNPSTVFTTKTTWAGVGLKPTGTMTITCTLPGVGACNSQPGSETFSTSACTASGNVMTCTFPAFNMSGLEYYGDFQFTATYSGDVNYSSSSAVDNVEYTEGVATTTVLSVTSGSPVTYGSGSSVVFKAVVTGNATDGAPTGSVTLTNPTLGTIGSISTSACTATNAYTFTCSITTPIPASAAVGSYTITASYVPTSYYYNGSSGTASISVAKAATTSAMTSPTSGSPVTQTKGSLTAFTVTGTLSWAGTGTDPTASDVTFSSTAAGTFGTVNCTSVTSPYICSATFTPTGTDGVGSYNINMTFAGDGNYTTSSSTQVGNYVIAPPPDIIFSSVTHNMGSVAIGNSTRYTVAVTNTTGTAIPFTAIALNTSASPNPFATQNNCGTSIPTGGCEIAFEYTPVAGNSGTQTATWSITGTAGGTTFGPSNGGTLTGTVAPSGSVTLTTAGHNFGNQTVGTTSGTYGTVLTNSTNAAVTLTLGSVTSPFNAVTNCPTTLGAGVSCNLQFTFSPTTTGIIQQVYSLAANGGAVPITVGGNPVTGITLTGTGD